MPGAASYTPSESCVSDSSKDPSALKRWRSEKANWVGQGDCRRHVIEGKVVLLGGGGVDDHSGHYIGNSCRLILYIHTLIIIIISG